jgi:regulator of sigma E protease
VQFRNGVPIDVTVDRAGRTLDIIATPGTISSDSPFGGKQTSGRLGVEARGGALKRYNPIEAIGAGARRTWLITETTVYSLARIITGHVDLRQLHSFIGIAKASGTISKDAAAAAQTAQVNPIIALSYVLLQIAASLSVSVGLLNLLPIPVLDGGHLLFYAYESVSRRPVSARVQAAGYRVGLALLLCLMLFATWNDLSRLRLFHFFGGLFS